MPSLGLNRGHQLYGTPPKQAHVCSAGCRRDVHLYHITGVQSAQPSKRCDKEKSTLVQTYALAYWLQQLVSTWEHCGT